MSLWHLIVQEMLYRRGNFLLALGSVVLAVGCLMGSVGLLNRFDLATDAIIAQKELAVQRQLAEMEEEFRRITTRMGFNILILPKDQNLADFYAENYATETMPESYAKTLADARDIVTIRHLLPMLQAKTEWPEQQRRILLIGVKGEMPWAHRTNLKPLLEPVESGHVVVGYELHRSLSLKQGDTLTLKGQDFVVSGLHPERGTIDDITLWIDLAQAQALLRQEGRINAMTALECQCAWADLPKVRQEIQAILPDVQVVELAGKALARAETRSRAASEARLLLDREKANRDVMRREREGLMAVLIPLVIAACTVIVGVLAFLNVRERRPEIGILRAMGLRSREVLAVFLGKAIVLGVLGAALGIAIAVAVEAVCGSAPGPETSAGLSTLDGALLVAVLLLTPLVTLLASWMPAIAAAKQDPAQVLSQE